MEHEKKQPVIYCTNKALMVELRKYHETGVISEELGEMFLMIARKFANRSNWAAYPQAVRDDFVGDAVLRMCSQLHKFDMTRKPENPFAYFSQIVFNRFIMSVKSHYKNINMKRDICEKYLQEIECNEHMDPSGFLKQVLRDKVNERPE